MWSEKSLSQSFPSPEEAATYFDNCYELLESAWAFSWINEVVDWFKWKRGKKELMALPDTYFVTEGIRSLGFSISGMDDEAIAIRYGEIERVQGYLFRRKRHYIRQAGTDLDLDATLNDDSSQLPHAFWRKAMVENLDETLTLIESRCSPSPQHQLLHNSD